MAAGIGFGSNPIREKRRQTSSQNRRGGRGGRFDRGLRVDIVVALGGTRRFRGELARDLGSEELANGG